MVSRPDSGRPHCLGVPHPGGEHATRTVGAAVDAFGRTLS